jgi:uncharacterized repeat protein (TIGR03803 family)
VELSGNAGGAFVLGGSATAQNGVATFSSLTADTTGNYTLTASDGKLTTVSSGAFTVAPGAPHVLLFKQFPGDTTVGEAFSSPIAVAVADQFDNVVTSDKSSVTMSVAKPTGATLNGTLTVAVQNGIATFGDLSVSSQSPAGRYNLLAGDGSLPTQMSPLFNVAPFNAYTLTTLTTFTGGDGVGQTPNAGLLRGPSGDLYGTTVAGGSFTNHGTVFDLVPDAAGLNYTLTSPAIFTFPQDGLDPMGDLAFDANHAIVGTTGLGFVGGGVATYGTIFKIVNGGRVTIATFSFGGGNGPEDGVVIDALGNMYGTTPAGGSGGSGTVYEYSAATQTLGDIVPFGDGTVAYTHGSSPTGDLVLDAQSNLFGVTESGGAAGDVNGKGTVFEVSGVGSTNTLTTLVNFSGANGATPRAGLIFDSAGNLYGTTSGGGASGDGTVFEISGVGTSNSLTTLASFSGPDGAAPDCSLIMDAQGNLYGTTATGGAKGYGTVFEISRSGAAPRLITLFSFDGNNGTNPVGRLVLDPQGNLYGVTRGGLVGNLSTPGTAFRLSPTPAHLVITQQPGDVTVGTLPSLQVSVEDAFGRTVAPDNSSVTLQIFSGGPAGATLGGTTTLAAHNGVATFNDLALTQPGLYRIKATDGILLPDTSAPFGVSAGAASQLIFSQPVSNTVAGKTIAPVMVQVTDQFHNVITSDHSSITLAIASGPSGAQLVGTLTMAAKKGSATFSNLVLKKAGTYALTASNGSFTMTSNSFTISPAKAARMVFVPPPAGVLVGQPFSVHVQLQDAFGNLATGERSNVTLLLGLHPAGSVLTGELTMRAGGGVADFAGLRANKAGNYVLKASDGSLPMLVSSAFSAST